MQLQLQLLSVPALAAIFFAFSCNGQSGISPWSISGGKLFIITDPETGASIYVPASLFYQLLTAAHNPYICDLLTKKCWLTGDRPAGEDEEKPEEPEIDDTNKELETPAPETGDNNVKGETTNNLIQSVKLPTET